MVHHGDTENTEIPQDEPKISKVRGWLNPGKSSGRCATAEWSSFSLGSHRQTYRIADNDLASSALNFATRDRLAGIGNPPAVCRFNPAGDCQAINFVPVLRHVCGSPHVDNSELSESCPVPFP